MKVLGGIRAQLRTLVYSLVALVLLSGAAGVVGVAIADRTVNRLTEEVFPAAEANAAVLRDFGDAASALRSWGVSGNEEALGPYRASLALVAEDHDRLLDAVGNNPRLVKEIAAQERAIDTWVSDYAEVRLEKPAGTGIIDRRLFRLGDRLHSDVRTANEGIQDGLDAVSEDAVERLDWQAPWTIAMLVLVSLLGTLALLVGRQIASRISRPLLDMQNVLDEWAAGDTDGRAVPSGPSEVRKVAFALNNFADENTRVRELEQQVVDQLTDLDRAKSDFLSSVSHELRTPLTSISGYVELIEDELQDGLTPEQLSMLEVVKRNVTRLRSLIEDLLSLSRAESEPFRTSFDLLDFGDIATGAISDLRATATQHRITFLEDFPDGAVVVRGDASQLTRALLNLISNAVKFSPDGSTITVRLHTRGEPAGGQAILEVIDEGIGIPAAEIPNLATRFFRASNAVDAEITGTGLGLRIVRAILDNHGGRLEVNSVEGVGTTARLLLPLVPTEGKKATGDGVEPGAGDPTEVD